MAANITMTNPTNGDIVGQTFTAYGTYQLVFEADAPRDKGKDELKNVPTGDYIGYFLLNSGQALPTTFSEVRAVSGNAWQLDLTVNVPNGTTKILHVVLVTDQNPQNCKKAQATLTFTGGAGIGLDVTARERTAAAKPPVPQAYHGKGPINKAEAEVATLESIVVSEGEEEKQDGKVKADKTWEVKADHNLKKFRNRRVAHVVRVKLTTDPAHWRQVARHQLEVDNT